MEIEKKEEQKEKVEVPNVIGLNVKEAKKILTEKGLQIKINKNEEEINEETSIITEQIPKKGITQEENGYVVCEIN